VADSSDSLFSLSFSLSEETFTGRTKIHDNQIIYFSYLVDVCDFLFVATGWLPD
jgi:hypothetical protein